MLPSKSTKCSRLPDGSPCTDIYSTPNDDMTLCFARRFPRTDSNDSLASSMASGFFGNFLSRNNSRAKGLMQRGGSGLNMLPPHLAREAAQAAAMQR